MATTEQPQPPAIDGYQLDPAMPLHRLAQKRMDIGRDLKIIITAKDSQTGVGKTTLAGWLAINWTPMFAGQEWFVNVDDPAEGMGTLDPNEYFKIVKKIGAEFNPGTVIVVDDAEELDARRSMQHLNVNFSQRWMLMRLKQAITILTLPSPRAIDTRLEELADIWINIEIRGRGVVHDIRVNSYGSRNVMTEKVHKIRWPDISDHPQLEKLRDLKEQKLDRWETEDEEDEVPEPDEVDRETRVEIAQNMRDEGMTVREIAEKVGRGRTWVSNNTEAPEDQ